MEMCFPFKPFLFYAKLYVPKVSDFYFLVIKGLYGINSFIKRMLVNICEV